MNRRIHDLLHDERGNLLEYLIVIGLVALIAIGAFTTFGDKVSAKVKAQSTTVGNVNDSAGP